jgi:hypothetical protein
LLMVHPLKSWSHTRGGSVRAYVVYAMRSKECPRWRGQTFDNSRRKVMPNGYPAPAVVREDQKVLNSPFHLLRHCVRPAI